MEYNKDMTIGEILESNKDAKAVLSGFGLHCFGCPMSLMETLEEASVVHGADLDLMISKLNELNGNKTKKIVERKKCCRKTKVK